MSTIFRRMPSWSQIIPVYGVIVIMIYAWTLLWFFWKVPSWLYFLNVGEILTELAYSLATNFLESLLVLLGPVLLALLLPRKWFYDVFIARGTSLCIAGLAYMMFLANQFNDKTGYPSASLEVRTLLLVAAGIAVLVYICGRIALVRKILEAVADRISIFVYILAPLSILSLLIVVVRSLVA